MWKTLRSLLKPKAGDTPRRPDPTRLPKTGDDSLRSFQISRLNKTICDSLRLSGVYGTCTYIYIDCRPAYTIQSETLADSKKTHLPVFLVSKTERLSQTVADSSLRQSF